MPMPGYGGPVSNEAYVVIKMGNVKSIMLLFITKRVAPTNCYQCTATRG